MSVFNDLPGVIHPSKEIASYEALWVRNPSVAKVSRLFKKHQYALPSEVAEREEITESELLAVKEQLERLLPFSNYSALFHGGYDYPRRLRAARNPIEAIYYQGNLDLLSSHCVAVVGTRKVSPQGILLG